jgi:iron complex transport system substrate-binding protein
MHAALANVRAQCAGASKPRVYLEEWGKPMIHSQPWVYELAAACGAHAVGKPGSQTNAEAVAAADPDGMVLAWCGAGDRVPLRRVVEQRGWQKLRCVRAGRVWCVPDEFLNTPAIPSLMDGLACLAAAIHPAIFARPERLRQIAQAAAPGGHSERPTRSAAAAAEA